MAFQIDTNLHWTEHYIEHGFCVIKGVLTPEFCKAGVAAFARALGTDLPPSQWSVDTLAVPHHHGRIPLGPDIQPFLDTIFDQPGHRNVIDTMFGDSNAWNGERHAQAFLCVFDPANKQTYPDWGHIDFVEVRIPILGNGFAYQASLVDTEPFSGNITIYPGYHKVVQKRLLEDATFWFDNDGPRFQAWLDLVPKVEPFEFIAEAGDLLLFHHLVGHQGNANAATNHAPRIAIHGHVGHRHWLQEIDPARPDLSPFERSLAHNGHIKLPWTEEAAQNAAYAERKFRRQMERWVAARQGETMQLSHKYNIE